MCQAHENLLIQVHLDLKNESKIRSLQSQNFVIDAGGACYMSIKLEIMDRTGEGFSEFSTYVSNALFSFTGYKLKKRTMSATDAFLWYKK